MSRWRKFREFDEKGALIERVEGSFAYTHRGYVFDRRIFRIYALIVILALVIVGMWSGAGLTEFSLHCPEDARKGLCENPFYRSCNRAECQSIVFNETLPAGFKIGNPMSEAFRTGVKIVLAIVLGGFIVAFMLNHNLHNKGRSLKRIFRGDE